VSHARLSQILQLNHLAPEIQEQLLFLAAHPARSGSSARTPSSCGGAPGGLGRACKRATGSCLEKRRGRGIRRICGAGSRGACRRKRKEN
jgi:hypothetical protein